MPQIAVIGSGVEWVGRAEEVGRLLAEAGCVVVCGGLGDVMAAAARGAKEAGGEVEGEGVERAGTPAEAVELALRLAAA